MAFNFAAREEDDEDDARERARLRAELRLMGIEQPGNPAFNRPVPMDRSTSSVMSDGHSSTFSASSDPQELKKLNRRSRSIHGSPNMSYNSRFESPLPENLSTFKGIEAMSAIEERDRQAENQLKQGRASGFTEPRRVSSIRRRESSRSSNTSNSGLRLTLDEPAVLTGSQSSSPVISPKEDIVESSNSWAFWRKDRA